MTQYAHLPTGTMLKKAFWSPNPALNIYRHNEDVACDIMCSDVPAVFDSCTAAVIFEGTSTKVTDLRGIRITNSRTILNIILFNEVLLTALLVTEVKLLLITK
jgi:hypothetical protein